MNGLFGLPDLKDRYERVLGWHAISLISTTVSRALTLGTLEQGTTTVASVDSSGHVMGVMDNAVGQMANDGLAIGKPVTNPTLTSDRTPNHVILTSMQP